MKRRPSAGDADRGVGPAREAREPFEAVRGELLVFAVEHLEIDIFRADRLKSADEFGRVAVRHDLVVSAVMDGNGERLQRGETFRRRPVRVFERTFRRRSAEAGLHVAEIMLVRFDEVGMPGSEVGNGTPDIDRAEDSRRILRGQQRGMAAARASEQEDVSAVHGRGPDDMLHRVEDVAPRLEAAAGVGAMRIRGVIRPAEFRQKQRPPVPFAQREVVFELIGPSVAPGVQADDERDGFIRTRTEEERRLKRAVERGFDLNRVRFSPRNEFGLRQVGKPPSGGRTAGEGGIRWSDHSKSQVER